MDSFQFGANGDIPQPADYDGDKKTDFAIFRSGAWYIRNSQTGNVTGVAWGTATESTGDFALSNSVKMQMFQK